MFNARPILLFAFIAIPLARADEPTRLPRDQLLLYRDEAGKSKTVKSFDDWAKRRAEIVRGMESAMGKLPGKDKAVPFDIKVEEEFDAGTYIRQLITYTSEPNCRTPAYLLVPKDVLAGKRKSPAILCLHETNFEVGHGLVIVRGERKIQGYAHELTERGYVTFAPNYPLLAKYQPNLKALGWESGSLKAVWDNMRGLDLLESLPYVEKKFATIGHSLGGHNSVFTSVFDQRILATVSCCGLDSFLDYYQGNPKLWEPQQAWCQTRYIPKLTKYKGKLEEIPFDFHEMIGAIAPRNMLIIAPTKDNNFRADSVDRIAKAAGDVYQLHGKPERIRVLHPESGHEFSPEMRDEAYKLLDAVLLDKK
jgi:hypothetical protein